MDNPFFERPVLNSPYKYPKRHWELDETGQPTQRIIESRRLAEFITPIPKPKKQKGSKTQAEIISTREETCRPRSSSTSTLPSSTQFANKSISGETSQTRING